MKRKHEFDQQRYVDFLVSKDVVKVGNFTLKNGSTSNVFFDFGAIKKGNDLLVLGSHFASYISEVFKDQILQIPTYDVIYGPAYKGISLALATSMMLAQEHHIYTSYLYDRKEIKPHGEGGKLIGEFGKGKRVLIIDDVITDCKTKYDTVKKLTDSGLNVVGVVVGLDREEFNQKTELSCRHSFSDETGVELMSLCRKSDIFK